MSFHYRYPPALGTTVKITNGQWKGESGTVHGLRGDVVLLVINVSTKKVIAERFSDLLWKRVMPPIGTKVGISMVDGWEGCRGTVGGYVSVTTSKITQTEVGQHYGKRAVVVLITKGDKSIEIPFFPENLLWNRLTPEVLSTPEEMSISEPGKVTGDITQSQLRSYQSQTKPQKLSSRRTALFQICLPVFQSRFTVRKRPTLNAAIHSHISNGDIVSLFLPISSFPEWWELESGGFVNKKEEEWVPLVMMCGVCKQGAFATEQAIEEHFSKVHPTSDFKVSVAGNFFPGPEPEPEAPMIESQPPPQILASNHRAKSHVFSSPVEAFRLQKPRRGFDVNVVNYRNH